MNNEHYVKHWKKYLTWTKKRIPKTCIACGCVWVDIAGINPRAWKATTVCSSECFTASRIASAKRNLFENMDPVERTRLNRKAGTSSAAKKVRRSKDEIALFELCDSAFSKVEHNVQLVNGWDADIIIHDIKTAILWNGPWHYKEMNLSNHSLKQVQNRDKLKIKELKGAGWIVVVYEDRHYTPATAFKHFMSNVPAA